MDLSCLYNRIGVSGCGAPTTEGSGPYVTPVVEALPVLVVNDLPGISLQNLTALVDEEDETFLVLWDKIVLRTLKKFGVLVKAKINECLKITDNEVVACLICENKELFDVALWYLHGTELMIERTSTDTLSRHTTIDLDKAEKLKGDFYAEFMSLLTDAVGSINICGTDCITECIEDNQSVRFLMRTP